MDCFVGIDVGTTNIKAAAYSIDGEQIAFHSVPTIIHHSRPDWSEFDAQELWGNVAACLRAVTEKVGGENVRSVGISSMAEAGVPLDEKGEVIYPVIAWYDPRTKPQADWLEGQMGCRELFNITGQVNSEKYGLCKLMWIKENLPEVYKRTAHWLSMEDYMIYRLTGNFATDYTIAARTLAFDIRNLKWSDEILHTAGIPADLFPKAYPGGTAVGNVCEAAAKETGLTANTVIATGGHDHSCAAIGVGILEGDVVLDSMGTSEVSMIATDKLVTSDEAFVGSYSNYPHCGKRIYRVFSSNRSSGSTIEWCFDSIATDIEYLVQQTGKNKYDLLDEKAARASGGAGLHFIPLIRGSVEGRKIRGTFFGVLDTHRSDDFVGATLRGICSELRRSIDGYEKVLGERYDKLRVVGGVTKSNYIMQLKATLSRRPVEVPVNIQSACYGAAMLGASGCGAIDLTNTESFYRCGKRFETKDDPDLEAAYQQYLALRGEINSLYQKFY